MPIDKVGVNLFYLPKKRLAFEFIIFHGKEVAFVNLALFNDGTAFAYLPVLPCDFFLGAYPFARFIIGCFFLVLAGTYQNALDRILQTGDYTPKQKKNNILKSKISTIYWLVVTAIFLYYTFGKNGNGQMQYSWIIWAIAGVLFGVLMIVIDLINKRRN